MCTCSDGTRRLALTVTAATRMAAPEKTSLAERRKGTTWTIIAGRSASAGTGIERAATS